MLISHDAPADTNPSRKTRAIRSADRLDPEPGVSAFNGDVLDSGAVAAAIEGHDGAIVCLGSTGLRDSTTLAAGTANIVTATKTAATKRISRADLAGYLVDQLADGSLALTGKSQAA